MEALRREDKYKKATSLCYTIITIEPDHFLIIRDVLLGLRKASEAEKILLDKNADGRIDISDLVLRLRSATVFFNCSSTSLSNRGN
jgi:hypothetical protein